MASGTKKKTTMAKMNRENKVRERRAEKDAKREARKRAALANPSGSGLVCNGAPCSYTGMIRDAFGDALAGAAEGNFSLIWGENKLE